MYQLRSSIGHQQHAVHSGADGGVVMGLVQQPLLGGGRLGRQGRPQKQPPGPQHPVKPVQKGGVGRRQISGQVLKIHVQPHVAPVLNGLKDLGDQPLLHGVIRQHHGPPLRVEPAGLRQGGKVHHRAGAVGPGGGEHGAVVQGQQAALGIDAVGKGGHIGEIGQLGLQQPRVDEGIGVAIEGGGSDLLIKIGDCQKLSRRQGVSSAQGPVVLPEGAGVGAVGRGDGAERLSRPDRVDLPGKPHHQGLSHRQGSTGGDVVSRAQLGGVHPVLGGDGVQGLPGPHNMDRHGISPLHQAMPAGIVLDGPGKK